MAHPQECLVGGERPFLNGLVDDAVLHQSPDQGYFCIYSVICTGAASFGFPQVVADSVDSFHSFVQIHFYQANTPCSILPRERPHLASCRTGLMTLRKRSTVRSSKIASSPSEATAIWKETRWSCKGPPT